MRALRESQWVPRERAGSEPPTQRDLFTQKFMMTTGEALNEMRLA